MYGSGTNPIPPGQRRRNSSERESDGDDDHRGVVEKRLKPNQKKGKQAVIDNFQMGALFLKCRKRTPCLSSVNILYKNFKSCNKLHPRKRKHYLQRNSTLQFPQCKLTQSG